MLLEVVENFLKVKPNSEWGLKQSTIFDINNKRFEAAIEKLQKLVRMKVTKNEENKEELCVLWILLSEVYKQQRNYQSAIRTCKVILEEFPNNVSASLQVFKLTFFLFF